MKTIDYVTPIDVTTESAYVGLHRWINKWYPRTGRCEFCGTTQRRTGYASASHNRYTRNRADWLELCYPCHAAFDGVAAKYRGKPRSAVTIGRMSRALTGRTLTDGHRMRIAAGLERAYKSGKRSYRLSVAQLAELQQRAANGESQRALAREYGISQTHVRRLIGGR